MPNKKAVIWLNNPSEIASKIEIALKDSRENVMHAEKWVETINQYPTQETSKRIWEGIKNIIQ